MILSVILLRKCFMYLSVKMLKNDKGIVFLAIFFFFPF